MIWTLFVLDFDLTYGNEYDEDYGVKPEVYQIPLDRQKDVEKLTREALRRFHCCADACGSIGDIFKELLEENDIKYHYVGELKIKFEDRQEEYIADYIPIEIV